MTQRLKMKSLLRICLMFTFISFSRADDNQLETLQVCEGELAHLSCADERTEIWIAIANFGRFSLLTCNPATDLDVKTSCANNATLQLLGGLCNGQQHCNFTVSQQLFGDPCPGTPKYLEAQYRCVAVTTTQPPTTTTMPELDVENSGSSDLAQTDQVDYDVHSKHATAAEADAFCAAEYYRLVQWPRTKRGLAARAACPIGSLGVAVRECGAGKAAAAGWAAHADLTDCVSDAVRGFEEENEHFFAEHRMTPLFITHELKTLVLGALAAGDLLRVSFVLERVQVHNARNEQPVNRDELTDTAKNSLQVMNHLLQPAQRDAWLDLRPDAQRAVAHRFLRAAQQSLRNIGQSLTAADVFRAPIHVPPHLQGAVAVVRVHANVELPQLDSADKSDRALFMLGEEMDKLQDDFELAFSSVSALSQFFGRASAADCSQTLISNVVSVSARRRAARASPLRRLQTVLSFATAASKAHPHALCARLDPDLDDFVHDPGCELLVHNQTRTICRCRGAGHYAVLASSCQVQTVYFGLNAETIALYASSLIALIGLSVFALGLTLSEHQKKPTKTLVARHVCACLIAVELVLSVWFAVPQRSWPHILLVYAANLVGLAAAAWILLQTYHLAQQCMNMFGNGATERTNSPTIYYAVGYGVPALITVLSALASANLDVAPQGRPRLRAAPLWNALAPLSAQLVLHLLFLLLTLALLCKNKRVGYEPCRQDVGRVHAAKKHLTRLAPVVLAADLLLIGLLMFVAKWTATWMWTIVAGNMLMAMCMLKSTLFKGAPASCLHSAKYNSRSLPKDSIFAPSVQPGHDPYSTKSTSVVQYFEDVPPTHRTTATAAQPADLLHHAHHHALSPAYVPRQGGVHDAHLCDHTYATIPAEYCPYYHYQQHHQHQQQQQQHYHAQLLQQLQQQQQQHAQQCGAPFAPPYPQAPLPSFPPPPAPELFQQAQQVQFPAYYPQRCAYEAAAPPPICNEHGPRCPSLAGLRMTPQLQHRPSSASASNVSSTGSPYESARSSSTTATTASGATPLLRMDMSRNMPVFFDESAQ